ncbi:hypothetical protein PHO31112_02393 [Pandoraea horticolens]|uniref:Uncharacterized protein n=1 Tax=Pandoraea horticolens TaxID=2508298 RepID=A0A5E4V3M5_9BURK|nr:hypothetical protein [Pandoraea horticolens]VVE06383.1 hypothetical protein PHO31112_02393 [Pandoraea horticolens]
MEVVIVRLPLGSTLKLVSSTACALGRRLNLRPVPVSCLCVLGTLTGNRTDSRAGK